VRCRVPTAIVTLPSWSRRPIKRPCRQAPSLGHSTQHTPLTQLVIPTSTSPRIPTLRSQRPDFLFAIATANALPLRSSYHSPSRLCLPPPYRLSPTGNVDRRGWSELCVCCHHCHLGTVGSRPVRCLLPDHSQVPPHCHKTSLLATACCQPARVAGVLEQAGSLALGKSMPYVCMLYVCVPAAVYCSQCLWPCSEASVKLARHSFGVELWRSRPVPKHLARMKRSSQCSFITATLFASSGEMISHRPIVQTNFRVQPSGPFFHHDFMDSRHCSCSLAIAGTVSCLD